MSKYTTGEIAKLCGVSVRTVQYYDSRGILLWSVGYWLCFGITYGYNAYFWDNGAAQDLGFSVFCWWLFGLWVIGLTILFSAAAASNISVLAGTGCVVLAS